MGFLMFICPKVFPITIPSWPESVFDKYLISLAKELDTNTVHKPVVGLNSIIDPSEFQQKHSRTGLGPELVGRDS